ncbi:putative YigZ family protein [Winogradskyella pacifica]|uniref:Putative YigZ family protein n=1 Tax=Winogradskyella pacifica TaxID=664642 RepID=A0A3D9LLL5_9FLAO|nr:YigZ family protein [Winogradskyella pacifica]REE08299.1 putative YigZ family protein [Winogradskyella pacifica]|tara:strand:+ start:176 stop:781 length:606 start_codon:yes stop_codon:yes gene_type:complete
MEDDLYKTITKPAQGELFKDKNSKFYGFTFPVTNEEQIKQHIDDLKKEHYAARHWCYAYQIGTETIQYRANDDGEPNNSAGMPIYGQIQSFEVTNILIVVIRYYGGVKLGVGGLINAYRTGAQLALEASKIVERTINKKFKLSFEYKNMSKVMRILKENDVEITNQTLELNCVLEISVRKTHSSKVFELFDQFFGVEIKEL